MNKLDFDNLHNSLMEIAQCAPDRETRIHAIELLISPVWLKIESQVKSAAARTEKR